MAEAISPVIKGLEQYETNFAEDQEQYKTLPALKTQSGDVLSRWKLTWRERLRVLFFGDLWLWVSTFNKPLQPVLIQINKPEVEN